MSNINKVIYDGTTLIDLTGDTVTQATILSGYTAHLRNGSTVSGSCNYDAYTGDADAGASEILKNKTAYVNGSKVVGNMTYNTASTAYISASTQAITIPVGYHDGSGKVAIDETEKGKITAGNIKSGVTILGVEGTYAGQSIAVESNVNVTPSSTTQIITPSESYDYIAQVTVAAIPCSTANNAYGITYTIG